MTEPTKEDAVGRKEPSGGNAEGNASLGSSGGPMEKLNILEDDGWMTEYTAKMVSPVEYAVLSLNNGQPSQHFVNLRDRSCTCEDKKYNVDRAAGMCTHQLYCMLKDDSPEERDTALLAVVAWASEHMANEADRLTRAATGHEADRAADSPAPEGSDTPDVEDAAQRLAEAFEAGGISHEMEWTHDTTNDGQARIWFAFDGKVPSGLFSAYIQEPDAVWYQPDDSPDDDKPNSIMVENVDGYIENVLE